MKIGLIGYGKMGQAVEAAALERGHEIPICMTSKNKDFSSLKEVDICIDFTTPEAVWENVQKIAQFKKDIVIGTTGWEDNLPRAYQLAAETPFNLLYAPNFSIGAYILKQLVYYTKELVEPFAFDRAGIEIHHRQKKDIPSGTARDLSEIPFTSVRLGNIIGTHQVIFNAGDDTIELTHRASSRMGFARGAIQAAEWLKGKMGVFTFDDFMKDTLCNSKELSQH